MTVCVRESWVNVPTKYAAKNYRANSSSAVRNCTNANAIPSWQKTAAEVGKGGSSGLCPGKKILMEPRGTPSGLHRLYHPIRDKV